MSSLWILLLIAGVGLASSGGPNPVYPIKMREIKHMMSLPSLPDECKTMDQTDYLLFAYVYMDNFSPGHMYCFNNRVLVSITYRNSESYLQSQFELKDNSIRKLAIINLIITEDEEPLPEDNEVFDLISVIPHGAQDNLPDDRMQHVVFKNLFTKGVNTKVLEHIHTLFLHSCKTVPVSTSSNPSLYIEADVTSVEMSVDCKAETVRFVDEDGATINVFTGSGSVEVPLIYNWKEKKFISDDPTGTLPTDTWHQIRLYEHYTRPQRDPIHVEYSNQEFPLDQLKNDFGSLWKRLLNSTNTKGYVILGDKMIANLKKSAELLLPGQKTGDLMKVKGTFDQPNQQIFFHDADFYNQDGGNLALPVRIMQVQPAPVSGQNTILVDYIDLKTLMEVFRSQAENIKDVFDKRKKDVPVEFVYKGRSFWTATFISNDPIIYLIENLQVLTVDAVDDTKVARKRVYDLVYLYFLPDDKEAFISHGTPLRNVLAVQSTPYQTDLLNNVGGLIMKSCTRTNSNPVLYFESPVQLVRMSVDCGERKANVADEDSEAFNVFPTSKFGHPSKTYVFDNDQTSLTLVEDSPDYNWVLRKPHNYAESERTLDIENELFIPLHELKKDLGELYEQMSPLLNFNSPGAVILDNKMIVGLTKKIAFPPNNCMEVVGKIEFEGDNNVPVFFDTNGFVEEIHALSPEKYVKLQPLESGISIVVEYIRAETFRRIIRSQSDTIRNMVDGKGYPQVVVDFVHLGRASLTAIYTINEGIEKYSIKNMRVLNTKTNDGKIFATKTKHRVVYFLPNNEDAFVTQDSSLDGVLAVRLPRYDPRKANYGNYQVIKTIPLENEFSDWKVILRVKYKMYDEIVPSLI